MRELVEKFQVEAWNAHSRPGIAVRVLLDDGSIRKTRTRSEAWLLGGHTGVVEVEGISGGYMLLRVAVDWE